ncbi:recombination regulator RecX [Fictibacillus fluitans]|uniref:Regulatory protein RecX n=1 Tax=Fictibacillus fluitans TaxID=3058422 RepID=A0ABT8I3G9_9BACL|nr:recombination regulator RecX [Fictibacillus sp. NE201]MDN4527576.1 recombination regulator RecX [Fictibacillus sp. NE201]
MTVITKITTQKKNTDRFNIYIDQGKGEEYGFSVDTDILIKYKLKKGLEIDTEELRNVLYEDEIKKGFNTSLQFLSFRMRSEKEVRDHLKKKEFEDNAIEEVIKRLLEYKYLDDTDFANTFVRSRKNTTSKGAGVITRELSQKGISQPVIEKALNEFPLNEQIESAASFAQKKANQNKSLSSNERRNKISQQLLQKGYSWDVIQEALQDIDMESSRDEEMEALLKQANKAHRRYKKFSGMQYRNKMKQHLYGKGFSVEMIDEVLNSDLIDQ